MTNWDITRKPLIVTTGAVVTAVLFMITIYETFRIPPLKDEIERLDRLINLQEKLENYKVTIKDLNYIIDNKTDTTISKIKSSSFNNKTKEQHDNKKNFNQIVTTINNLTINGKIILETKLNDKNIVDIYKDWQNKSLQLVESIEGEYRAKYLDDFKKNVWLENVDPQYQLIHTKVKEGENILLRIRTIYENK